MSSRHLRPLSLAPILLGTGLTALLSSLLIYKCSYDGNDLRGQHMEGNEQNREKIRARGGSWGRAPSGRLVFWLFCGCAIVSHKWTLFLLFFLPWTPFFHKDSPQANVLRTLCKISKIQIVANSPGLNYLVFSMTRWQRQWLILKRLKRLITTFNVWTLFRARFFKKSQNKLKNKLWQFMRHL